MESLMKYVARTSRCTALHLNEMLEPLGVNGHQYSYIIHICRSPGISQDQLAKKIYIDKSNVARQLPILEKNGFITRTPLEADRRQMQVYPTEKAVSIYPKIRQILREWNQFLVDDFTENEQELLLSLMEKVMDKAIDKVYSKKDE